MTYTVTEQWRADRLTRGTRINDFGEQVVVAVRPKAKYTYVDLAPSLDSYDVATDVKFGNDELVSVLRTKNTPEEQAVIALDYAQKRVESQAREVLQHTPTERLIALVQSHDARQKHSRRNIGGQVLDWSSGSGYLELQATYDVYAAVDNTRRRLIERFGESEITWLSAMTVVADERSRRDTLPSSPMSRSTNGFSNMLEDLSLWAWDKFIDQLRWLGSPQIFADELKRLERLTPLEEQHGV